MVILGLQQRLEIISQPDSLKIHYTRNSYKLSFYNVNSESKTETVLYEDSLKQYASYTPARPNGLANYYTFDGWYTDADCQNKFNFDSEMPANDLQLYAKWVAPTFSVIFYNGSDIYQKVTGITAENTIDTIVPPTDSVKTFAGWVKEDGTPFSFAQKITSNMNIYAKWMGGKISEVSYDANGGTGTVTDKMHYYENAQAQVASADGLTAPDGKVFIGWKSSVDNAIYYPGSLIKIGTSNIIFKAQWADKAATTKLVYDFNGGIDSEGNKASVVETLLENGQVAVANYVVSRSDYVFIGWNTAKDGTGAMVQAGNKVQIDNASQFTTDTNTLFAQWVKLTHLQIEGSKKTCIYTGEIQSNNEIKVIGLPAGYTYENVAVNAASGKNVDSYKGTVDYSKIVIKDKSGNDVTNLFKIDSATAPELVITPRAVIVTANDKSKVYGTADPTLDATVAGTLGTDTVTYTTSRVAGENVGTYTITPAGEATQGNYSVTYATGTLTITKAPAEQNAVTAGDYNKPYDAKAHGITASSAVTDGTTLYYSTDNATWSETAPTWTDVTAAQTVYVKAVNANYEDATASATVTITPKAVTVTANDKSKVYGTADPALDATVAGTLGTDTVTYTTSRVAGENVGTYTITPAGEATQGNYSVTYATGTLTITKAPAEQNAVTAGDYNKPYDAKAHGITASSAVTDGTTLYYSTDNATWSETAPTWTEVTAAQTVYVKAVNANYEDATASATVTITPKAVTVTANDKSKVYGTKDPALDATVAGTLGTDTVTYTTSRVAGENVGTYTITPAGEATQGNYSVTYATGTLTITKAPAEQNAVTAGDYNKPYDAKAHGITASSAVTDGTTLYYSTDNATWSETAPTWTEVTAAQTVYVKAVNANYEDATASATVTITPKAVTVTANDKSKVYGTKDPTLDATVAGTLGTDTVTYTTSRVAGENVGTYAIKPDGDAAQGNYSVTYANGTLTITKAPAEQNAVTAETYNGTYDGAAHSILNVKATQSDSTLYYTTEKPQNTVLFALFNLFGAQQEDTRTWSTTLPTWTDVTAAQTVYVKATNPNYEDSYTSATVTITKRNVTLTSGTATKVYDGTALTNDTVTISDQGFVAGQSVTYAFTGTQTEVGSSNNTFTYAVNDGTDANNYDIAIVTGTLTITARPTTPVVPDRPASPTTDDRNARPSTPNTGDQTNAPMAAGALAFSMLLAGLAFFFRRKYSD